MATPMSRLLEEVSRHHFPYPPATPEQIEEFERRVGWRLDPDLRAFYLHCNGAELFKQRPGCPYRILPLSEIIRARVAIYDKDDDQWGPASVYALCYVQDGDYVVVDVGRQENGRYPLVDGWHEAWPDPKQWLRQPACLEDIDYTPEYALSPTTSTGLEVLRRPTPSPAGVTAGEVLHSPSRKGIGVTLRFARTDEA